MTTAKSWKEYIERGIEDLVRMDPPKLNSESLVEAAELIKEGNHPLSILQAVQERASLDGLDCFVVQLQDVWAELSAAINAEREARYKAAQTVGWWGLSPMTQEMMRAKLHERPEP